MTQPDSWTGGNHWTDVSRRQAGTGSCEATTVWENCWGIN